jgi:hypothetical protein
VGIILRVGKRACRPEQKDDYYIAPCEFAHIHFAIR